MFEIGIGEAIAIGANMRDQDRALQAWMNACAERDAVIERLQDRVKELEQGKVRLDVQAKLDANSIADLKAKIQSGNERQLTDATTITNLRSNIATLRKCLQDLLAIIAGQDAVLRTVRVKSPNCEALKPTGQKFGDGREMTFVDLAYAEAYDAKAIEMGRQDLADARRARAAAAG